MEVSGEQTRWWGLLKGGVGSRLLSELKLLVTGTFEHIVERNRNVFLGWREGGWQNLGEGAGPRGACLMWGRDPVAGGGAGRGGGRGPGGGGGGRGYVDRLSRLPHCSITAF